MSVKRRTPIQYIQDKTSQLNGCWIWNGKPTNAGYGLGTYLVNGKWIRIGAHRLSYETFVGKVPKGLVLDHLCRNRMCVNPTHLEAVSQRENVLRSPISLTAQNTRKTHCPQGHKYDLINTYKRKDRLHDNRGCRICRYNAYLKYKTRSLA